MDDKDVVKIVERFSGYLSQVYKFGFFEIEDLKQEAYMKAVEAARDKTFISDKEAEKYLFMVVQNHFKNLLRKYRKKNDPPCLTCPLYDPNLKSSKNQCTKFEKKDECPEFAAFEKSYKARQSLLQPCDIDGISDYEKEQLVVEDSSLNDLCDSELYSYIDQHLKPEFRSDFLRMLSGINLNAEITKKIQKEIATLLLNGDFEITVICLDDFVGE